ncbi:biotin--[acetyl-CoA-carboxylase] ligase [Candidatus Bathyarchaeota archaeon]|nr:MAG: biotin--[acetyl-CoA-carboxylase] ligase [Candidatus Bathyarchaeota archaeon]
MKNESLNIEKLKRNLKTVWLGRNIHHFEKIDSTNSFAKKLAEQGAEEGVIVIADTQTCGKGRLGRRWESPKGGIWLSIILRPKLRLKEAVKISMLAAVAVAKTLREEFKLNAEVKWPNDVLVGWKKVCGILAEAVSEGEETKYAVVGIGINANFDLSALSSELREKATSLKEILGKEIDREDFLCCLLKNFEFYYENFKRGRFDIIVNEWRKFSCVLGRGVHVSNHERFEGLAEDIDENGWLIVRLKDGTLRKVFSADVTVRIGEK